MRKLEVVTEWKDETLRKYKTPKVIQDNLDGSEYRYNNLSGIPMPKSNPTMIATLIVTDADAAAIASDNKAMVLTDVPA